MLKRRATVLIVDDEPRLLDSLAQLFQGAGYGVQRASDGDEALGLLRAGGERPDAMFLDLRMPRRDGLSVLHELKADPVLTRMPVVVVTALAGSEQTISAMKAGAYDYIGKPFDAQEVLEAARRAVEMSQLLTEVERLREAPGAAGGGGDLIGHHPAMRQVFKMIGMVASSDATVLITGESGTGKELVAQAIHRHSARAEKPLVVVNCGAIPEALLESQLFGHERGAFTGALQSKPGQLELAAGGTVFLDEIGELPAGTQVKLLRVLQEHAFQRVGANEMRHVDFRVIAATNRDLASEMREGRFREDLFYRLSVVRLEVPPLRARRSDIPELAEHFLHRHGPSRPDPPSGFTDDAMRALLLHDYPGNVRELENAVQRAVVVARGPVLTAEDLPETVRLRGELASPSELDRLLDLPLEKATRELERLLISRALERAGGNKTGAARELGIHRQHLYAKLKELGLE